MNPLNDTGRQQAALAGARLSKQHFDLVLSSDLTTPLQTAEIIAEKNQEDLKVETSQLFRERSFGSFDGRPYAEFMALAAENGFEEDHYLFRAEGGENADDLKKRAAEAWRVSICNPRLLQHENALLS